MHQFVLSRAHYLTLSVALFLAALFSQPHSGGAGLYLPFNVTLWAWAGLFILFSLAYRLQTQGWTYNPFAGLLTLWFALLGLAGLVNTQQPLETLWLWALSLSASAVFFWSLLQLRWSHSRLHWVFWTVLMIAAWQSLVALIQTHDQFGIFYYWFEYWPFKINNYGPIGVFQQVNILASFLTSALLISFYLIATPYFYRLPRLVKVLLFILVVLFGYVLFSSGSRAGFLAMLVAIPLLHYARWHWIKRAQSAVFLWWLAFVIGIVLTVMFPGERGLGALASKFEMVASGQDIRWFLYSQSFLTYLQAPWLGYGLGEYTQAFLDFSAQHPPPPHLAQLKLNTFTHPHNELLFWMIQSGLTAWLGVLILAGYFIWILWRHHSNTYAWTLLALSFPMWMHSLLCYPFSLSALHWMLLLFFMVLVVRMRSKTYRFKPLGAWRFSLWLASPGLVLVIVYAAWYNLKSIQEMFYFENVYYEVGKQTPQQIADTLYFEHATTHWAYCQVVEAMMNRMLDKAIADNNQYDIAQFKKWVARHPNPSEQSLNNLERLNTLTTESN